MLSPRGWQKRYRHHQVLAAFAAARADLPPQSMLLFVQMGRDSRNGKSVHYLQTVQAQALGLQDQVRFLPAFPPAGMATLYNAADVVVSTCVPDAFPVSVLEALACARPVIVPDLPTFADSVIICHCRCMAPDSPAALAAALGEMAVQPPPPDALAAARADVLARYDTPVARAQLGEIYAATLAQGG